jgi:hypothetical protein
MAAEPNLDLGLEYTGGINKPTADQVGNFARVVLDTQGDPNLDYTALMPLSVDLFGGIGDGVTSDQAALVAAVQAAFSRGVPLVWPNRVFVSTATIPHLHDVKHLGQGAIKRGSDLFAVQPNWGNTNTLYVATDGSSSNDGLSAAQPMASVQNHLDALRNYGFLDGTWRCRLAAGSYAGGSAGLGIQSRNRLEFYGPDVGGHPNVPTAVISGSVGGSQGWYFQRRVQVYVQDIKFLNFVAGAGLTADGQCDLYTKNVHCTNCYDGIDLEQLTQGRIEGGILDGCVEGARAYSQCSMAIGYNAGGNRALGTVIKNCTQYGTIARDSSRIHADDCKYQNNSNIAFYIEKNTRGVANNCEISGNGIGVRSELNSVYGESTPNTFTTNGKDVILYSSVDETSNYQAYFDRATGRTLRGANAYATPPLKDVWVSGTGLTVTSYNSNVRRADDLAGSGSNYVGLGVPNNASAGWLVATPSNSAQAWLAYDTQNNRWRLSVNSNERYQFDDVGLLPLNDNTRKLGDTSNRWTTVYAATGTINTSDENEKAEIEAIPDRVLDAWAEVDWVRYKWRDAIETKGDGSRWHYGAIAQRVRDAFANHGLDPFEHGVLCLDRWEAREAVYRDGELVDPAREAGERYGLRYDEAFALEAAWLRREMLRR